MCGVLNVLRDPVYLVYTAYLMYAVYTGYLVYQMCSWCLAYSLLSVLRVPSVHNVSRVPSEPRVLRVSSIYHVLSIPNVLGGTLCTYCTQTRITQDLRTSVATRHLMSDDCRRFVIGVQDLK